MQRWYVVILLTLALSLLAATQSATPLARTEDQLIQIERDWLAAEATGDTARLRPLFDEGFIATGPGGNLLTRDDLLPLQNSPENHLPKSTLEECTVKVFGDAAVLMGRVAVQDPQYPMQFRITTVFQKREQGWRVIAAQMAKAPGAEE
jgi:hypothetical protein